MATSLGARERDYELTVIVRLCNQCALYAQNLASETDVSVQSNRMN